MASTITATPATKHTAAAGLRRRVWIDFDNSPHVPFFLPVIQELERRGYELVLTGRDAYQVRELLDFHHVPCTVIGRHHGKNKFLKVGAVCFRTLALAAHVFGKRRPHLGVSHGSRAQQLACLLLRIPSLMIIDYEFAATTRFINPTWAMVPDVLPASSVAYTNCTVVQYPGIKEDVYLSRFRPDPSLRGRLGIGPDELFVLLRPPASEAHYHNPESELLLEEVLRCLADHPEARTVILPRNERQAAAVRERCAEAIAAGTIIVPRQVEDGLNLIWNADLVISGGGTMNREAAAMGVPVYSIFRGRIGAVDHYLADQGRMVLLESPADVRARLQFVRRPRSQAGRDDRPSPALISLTENIASMVENGRPWKA